MGAVKRFLEEVSVDIGHGGEITGATIREGEKRLQLLQKKAEERKKKLFEELHQGTLRCRDHESEILTPETFGGLFDGEPLCKDAWRLREEFLDSVPRREVA